MAPLFRLQEIMDKPLNENEAKKAAVLILFYPDRNGITNFVLIERVVYSGVHSGQISFPGGKRDFEDKTFWDTALRETQEEVGVEPSDVKKIRELSKFYIPPSNFTVYPFVGFVSSKPAFVKEIKEVEKIIEIPLSKLLDAKNETKGIVSTSYVGEINVPMYVFENVQVWGATATILAEMKELILIALKE
ncbi:CoA pyrophosphatase [Flavobacteriaceae bacterium]|nr:CoA pyrophosphatase [Flavobacteriaceae bacterium]